jgi:hypothetical protein
MGKVWKYSLCQLDSQSQILLFSTLLSSVFLLLYSTQSSLQVFAENSQGLSTRNVNLQPARNNSSEIIAANTHATHIKAAATNSSATIIGKLSDKGIYKVQLRSNESFSLLPKNGFDMQIQFLNANASKPSTTSIIEGRQQQQPIPVNSFDITIYSNNGKVLWQKTNQTIIAATAFEKVAFTNDGGGYNSGGGGITIQVTNIKPSLIPLGTAMPLFGQNSSNSSSSILGSTGNNNNNKTSTDSVTFTAALAK